MLRTIKKYPYLSPLLGLLMAYCLVASTHVYDGLDWGWLSGVLLLSLLIIGYLFGYRRFHGGWRLASVCLFHLVLGVWWFGDDATRAKAVEWPWKQGGRAGGSVVLLEVRDSWLAGPMGIKGTVYCLGWRGGQRKMQPLDLCFRVSLKDSGLKAPAMGRYWVPSAAVNCYGDAEIPGEPNWRAIMRSLGMAGYVQYGDFWRYADGPETKVSFAYTLRSQLLVWLHREFYLRMDSKHAGLVYAMLLGDKSGLDPQMEAQFGSAGLLHVLAVSGMHVALIMGALFWIFSGFGARGNPGLVLLGMLLAAGWGYTFLTGAGASVVRAMISATWMWLGKYAMKRKQSLIHVLTGSAYLQWLFDPACVTQMGFQLSYLAVLGIALFQPLVTTRFSEGSVWRRWLTENIALTLSATLFTLPLLLWQFHQFPTWFLLGNLVLLPLFSICVYIVLGCLALGWIPFLGDALYALFDACLDGLLTLLGMGERLPIPQLNALPMDGWDLCLMSLLLACLCKWLMQRLAMQVSPSVVERRSWHRFDYRRPSLLLSGLLFLGLWGHLEWQRNLRARQITQFEFHLGREVVLVKKRASNLQVIGYWRNMQKQRRAWQKLQIYATQNGVAHVEWINRLPLYYD